MQLSPSTTASVVPSDPNLLALLCPGAGPAAADCGGFEQLFAGAIAAPGSAPAAVTAAATGAATGETSPPVNGIPVSALHRSEIARRPATATREPALAFEAESDTSGATSESWTSAGEQSPTTSRTTSIPEHDAEIEITGAKAGTTETESETKLAPELIAPFVLPSPPPEPTASTTPTLFAPRTDAATAPSDDGETTLADATISGAGASSDRRGPASLVGEHARAGTVFASATSISDSSIDPAPTRGDATTRGFSASELSPRAAQASEPGASSVPPATREMPAFRDSALSMPSTLGSSLESAAELPAPASSSAALSTALAEPEFAFSTPHVFARGAGSERPSPAPLASTSSPSAPRSAPPLLGHEANFADTSRGDAESQGDQRETPDKSFVSSAPETLTSGSQSLGIGVANSAAAMPNLAAAPTLPHPAFEYTDAGVAGASVVVESTPEFAATEASAVADAHRAVEAVLTAVDRVAGREQTAVRMQFSVGDAELSVRVELHADEVRTTFSTDSAELRSALAQEWQAVAGGSGERGVRLASAVFAAAEQGAGSFSGDSSPRQQQRHAAPTDDTAAQFFAHGSHVSSPAAAAPAFAPAAAFAPAGTAQRLHLFA